MRETTAQALYALAGFVILACFVTILALSVMAVTGLGVNP